MILNERRRFPRRRMCLPATIKEDGDDRTFRCEVETIDISLGGLSVKITGSPSDSEKAFSAATAYTLRGKTVMLQFSDPAISMWGQVVRVDRESMLMAVVITKVSDVEAWKGLCAESRCA